jgi:hypothetical protein
MAYIIFFERKFSNGGAGSSEQAGRTLYNTREHNSEEEHAFRLPRF